MTYSVSFDVSEFIIFTLVSAVYSPVETSSTKTILLFNSIVVNANCLFSNFASSVLLFSCKHSIPSLYIHTSLFCSWYSIFIINLSVGASYLYNIASFGLFCANSIETTWIFDCIKMPDKSTSAIANNLLSCDIHISATLDETKFVLNISFPSLSNTSTIDL